MDRGGIAYHNESNLPASLLVDITSIAGEGDMNMTDLVALNNDLDKTQTKHRIIFFNGKHEWAPENIMNIAFAGLQLDAMRNKFIPKNDSLISAYINDSKKRLEEDLKKKGLGRGRT